MYKFSKAKVKVETRASSGSREPSVDPEKKERKPAKEQPHEEKKHLPAEDEIRKKKKKRFKVFKVKRT